MSVNKQIAAGGLFTIAQCYSLLTARHQRLGGLLLKGQQEVPMHNPYKANGYADRNDYLDSLREEYGELVDILITVLPASEDFDGLVSELEDATLY
jgi:hypothetical protein